MDTRKEREQVWTATTTALKMKKSSGNGSNKDSLDVFGFEKGKLPPRVQLISNTKAISATNPDLIFKKA